MLIEFKHDRRAASVIHTSQTKEPPMAVVSGYFYAVRMENTALESFTVCKAEGSLMGEFQARKYIKSEAVNSNDVVFKETIFSYTLNTERIIGQLVSARVVGSLLFVNTVEIEELLISAIST